MMGLYQAGRVDKGYHTALCALCCGPGIRGCCCAGRSGVPDLLGYILEFAVVYLVCTKTARRLEAEGDLSTAARGGLCGNSMRPAWRSRSSPASLCPIMGERLVWPPCWLHWSLRWRTPSL